MINLPDRYSELCSPIEGGYGNVIICQDKHLNREVVIKQINDQFEIDRLYIEIEALQKAKSKHVVEIYDVIISDDDIAIVEEFLIGDDLSNFRASNDEVDEYIEVLFQLASGLADIHEFDIVHRDFKPNNVKYDAEHFLKIFDFGLAKFENLPTSTIGLVGTQGYMAPELYLDQPIIDKPVDCYAFGVNAFEFVIGKIPRCARNRPTPRPLTPDERISNFINLKSSIASFNFFFNSIETFSMKENIIF